MQLIAPREKNNPRQCVHWLISNISDGYNSVLFYNDGFQDYDLSNSIQNPFIQIDGRKQIYNLDNYRNGKDVVVITLPNHYILQKYLKKMYSNFSWTISRRKVIIILPLTEERNLHHLFMYVWKNNIVEVVLLYYDTNTIKIFTANPQHPDHDCGKYVTSVNIYTCDKVKNIRFPKIWQNYNDCEFSYWYTQPDQYKKYVNQMYFKVLFVLETLTQRLNLTISPKLQTNVTSKDSKESLIHVGNAKLCKSKLFILTYKELASSFDHKEEGDTIYNKIKEKIVYSTSTDVLKAIINKTDSRNFAILTTDLDYDSIIKFYEINIPTVRSNELMRHEVVHTLVTNAGNFLSKPINKIVVILIESGLMDYQQRIYKDANKNYTKYYHNEVDETEEDKVVLGMKHVYPVFVFWGISLVVSTIIFFLELLTYAIREKSREH
ncbi:hypothetical protein FQA39_LY03957 [Lamprigera yunnana]|nr:hypothetical protein FQA39_LY03957 [Lamprigera yunnana]